MSNDKYILDAFCGGRCFWFNKQHPNTLYIDKRIRLKGHDNYRPNHCIMPDMVIDNKELPFEDKSFKMVVMDPPHLIGKPDSCRMIKKYGQLNKDTWREDLKASFDECWRVLDDYGVLVFKWNEGSIGTKEVIRVLGRDPLFGHPTLKKTKWFIFMKNGKDT